MRLPATKRFTAALTGCRALVARNPSVVCERHNPSRQLVYIAGGTIQRSLIGLVLCLSSDADQRRAEDAGGVAELMLHDGRLQFIGEDIFPDGRDPLGIDGRKI
jgi:hypothetical protein